MFYLSKSKQNQNCDQFFLNISMTSFNKMYFFHGCIWKHITFLYETILWPPSYGPLINRYDPPRAPTTPTYRFPAPLLNKMSSSRSLRRCGPSSSATRRGWFPSGNKRSLNFLKAVFLPIFWRKNGAPLETKGSSIFWKQFSLQYSLVNILLFLQYFESPHTSSDSTTFDWTNQCWLENILFMNLDSLFVNVNCVAMLLPSRVFNCTRECLFGR